MNKMISKDFYEKLLSGKMGRLDIINAIEKITDSNLVKVKALKDDLEMYLGKRIYYPFMEHPLINLKEEPESDISQEEREKKLVTITWGNSEICKIRIPNSIGNKGIIFPAADLSKPAPDFVELEDDRYLQVCEVINSLKEKIKLAENPNSEKAQTPPPKPIVKQNPELPGKQITFKNSETIEKLHTELKGYFPNKEAELLKALQGEQLTEILLFPHNQNKFVEVFRRLKYNGFLLNTDTETKTWICSNFQFKKKGFLKPQPFNQNTVWNNLNKGKGEPTKKERICFENVDWLPYKSPKQIVEEAQKEKL